LQELVFGGGGVEFPFLGDVDLLVEFTDPKTLDAGIRNFSIIGEAANRLTKKFRQSYPEVPWEKIVGMCNFVVHEYFEVRTSIRRRF
jgi:uncharacterized protein with HEPN domain